MKKNTYFSPDGGLPPQSKLLTDRAVFKSMYHKIAKIITVINDQKLILL